MATNQHDVDDILGGDEPEFSEHESMAGWTSIGRDASVVICVCSASSRFITLWFWLACSVVVVVNVRLLGCVLHQGLPQWQSLTGRPLVKQVSSPFAGRGPRDWYCLYCCCWGCLSGCICGLCCVYGGWY